jgi:protein-S-isoprenylcysteine O-methyltransferase Ste14
MNMKQLSIIAFVISVLALLTLIASRSLFAQGWFPITIQIGVVCLMIWARLTFGLRSFHAAANPTSGGLITIGPYRFIRHPIYASVIYFVWAGVLSHLSLINVCLGIIVIAGLVIRIRSEERLLIGMYPEYAAYAARTKRIVPFVI